MIKHIAGRKKLEAGLIGDPREARKPPRIVAAIEMVRDEIGTVWKIRRDPAGDSAMCGKAQPIGIVGRQQRDDEPRAMGDDVRVIEMTFALRCATFAEGQ